MRKFILVAFVAVLMASCSYDTIYEGARVDVQYITVYPGDWVANPVYPRNEGYASATFSMPMISDVVIDRGAVMCYLVGDYDDALPFSMTQLDNGIFYTNTISFEIAPGIIQFISENSDSFISSPGQPLMIKVVAIYNP
jgi:hypothetical protein